MKNFFKRSLPPVSQIKSHPKLQFLGTLLHEPNLWHLNRRSLAGGMAVGLFIAFVPSPMQMLLAATVAIYFRVNLPLSVSLVWITNPLTMLPIYYFGYKLGTVLLGQPALETEFSLSQDGLFQMLWHSWQPLLLGCFVLSSLSALTGYLLVNLLWRLQVGRLWRERRENRIKLKKKLLAVRKLGPLGNMQH